MKKIKDNSKATIAGDTHIGMRKMNPMKLPFRKRIPYHSQDEILPYGKGEKVLDNIIRTFPPSINHNAIEVVYLGRIQKEAIMSIRSGHPVYPSYIPNDTWCRHNVVWVDRYDYVHFVEEVKNLRMDENEE